MKKISDRRHDSGRRKAILTLGMAVGAFALAMMPAARVDAHHGWNSFNTKHAYYAQGTVTYVRWGNPHSEVRVKVENTEMPANWKHRQLPEGAREADGQATMDSARPYGGEHEELHLVLAGPRWMEQFGMDRPLEVGEKIEVVGYLGASDSHDLRPVMFWLADGKRIWQQLTAFPERPEVAPEND